MKTFWKTAGIIFTVLMVVCIVVLAVWVHSGYGISEGRFYRAENGSTMLLDERGATVLTAQSAGLFENLNNGDKILVVHDGVEESYPARTGAYYCIRLEEGGNEDLPENVLATLQELGWVTQVTEPEPEPTPDISTEIPFSVQYIRTNGDGMNIPNVTAVTSVQQLQSYYVENKDYFDLERKEQVYSDTTIGFLDACDEYDDSFFADNMLLLITLEEGSGSIRHEVTDVYTDAVYIKGIVPEVGTCDMAHWHIFIAVPKDSGMDPAEDIAVFLDDVDLTEEFTTAQCGSDYANISLKIPEGWEYEVDSSSEDTRSFGIRFWPAGEDGKISVTYMGSGWGVCGTGLRVENTMVGNYPVSIGYYGQSAWDYILFSDLPGAYVVQRQGTINWWSQHGEKAMEILSSVRLAEGFLTESDAIAVAINRLGDEKYKACDDIWVKCDTENGIWTVEFFRNTEDQETVSVDLDFYGNILSMPE